MNWLEKLMKKNAPDSKTSAQLAKDRLKVVVQHQRQKTGSTRVNPEIMRKIHEGIFKVISQYIAIDQKQTNRVWIAKSRSNLMLH